MNDETIHFYEPAKGRGLPHGLRGGGPSDYFAIITPDNRFRMVRPR